MYDIANFPRVKVFVLLCLSRLADYSKKGTFIQDRQWKGSYTSNGYLGTIFKYGCLGPYSN